jgi:hypothetical protein
MGEEVTHSSVFLFLADIRQRPTMYVGITSPLQQLWNLEMLLSGYSSALQRHGLPDGDVDFVRDFARWLYDTRDWSASLGPVAAIRDHTSSEEEAWDTFWRLVDEYRDSLSEPQG